MNNTSLLYKRITSDENIYNAIYALESYIFERGLLSESDSELYNTLADKYNNELIEDTIAKCKEILKSILIDGQLFTAKVYFKLKKMDDSGKPVFRPLHSSDLKSQICMVCMLQALMFDDTAQGRKLSPLSMMIPHNFYGNIPSTNLRHIFLPWKEQYKKYQDDVMAKCKEYKANNKYDYEITLDLKDFFPSIDPGILITYLLDYIYAEDENEIDDYKTVLRHLLTCKLDEDDILPWKKEYYGESINGKMAYITKGIPQGLPQSYFFGNLVMVKISELVNQVIKGDAYYYVDDSVIYTDSDEISFNDAIRQINNSIHDYEQSVNRENLFPNNRARHNLYEKLKYGVAFHEKGKSAIYQIGQRMDPHFLFEIGDQLSKTSQMFLNIDEIDENSSREKLDALIEVVDRCRQSLQDPNGKNSNDAKLLMRYRKYFRFRQSLLQLREQGDVTETFISNFISRFIQTKDLESFFDYYDSDIFQTEARLIVLNTEGDTLKSFIRSICKLEEKMMRHADIQKGESSLYFRKDLQACTYFGTTNVDPYASLRDLLRTHYRFRATQKNQKKYADVVEFWRMWIDDKNNPFTPAASYVKKHSFSYSRLVMNAYVSWVFNVDIDDRTILYKNNHRHLLLKEYRLLSFLRNLYLDEQSFKTFLQELMMDDDPLEKVEVSPSLSEVMGIFYSDVRNPNHIDHLIRTHIIVSCLWKNGSKFMHAYTLHNEEHSVELIRQASRLAKIIDYFSLKGLDYYILFLACYLHDISMVIHPDLDDFSVNNVLTNKKVSRFIAEYKDADIDGPHHYAKMKHVMLLCFKEVFEYFEDKIRSNHPVDSANFIRNRSKQHFSFMEATVLELVAKVSESHGYNVNNVYGLKSEAKKELYSLKYMMILIRLADLMDITHNRVNYILLKENFKHMGEVSRFHWISHYITEGASIHTNYRIKDEDVKLFDRPIQEQIIVEINMSSDCRIIKEKNNCHGWERDVNDSKDKAGTRILRFTPSGGPIETRSSSCKRCDSMCYWIWLKNKYLFNELEALQDYLKNVNGLLIDTQVIIEVTLSNKTPLDKELYDGALEFVNKT